MRSQIVGSDNRSQNAARVVTNLNLAGIDDRTAILSCQAARFEDVPLDINVLDLKSIASRNAQETAHDSVYQD